MLGKEPILVRTLKALNKNVLIDRIILVISRRKLKKGQRLVKKYKLNKVCNIVSGGKRRFDSVREGLRKAENADFILIHDGVRPFVDRTLIKKVLLATKKFGAALSATPSKQTVKLIGRSSFVLKTPKRRFLWEAQTPQGFKKNLIVKAYKKSKDSSATDDSSLVEKMGYKVKIVKGSYRNIKITTPEDLKLAETLLERQK